MTGNGVTSNLHQYLEDNDINSIVISIVEMLLMKQPKEPIGFIVNHLLVSYLMRAHGNILELILINPLELFKGEISISDKALLSKSLL